MLFSLATEIVLQSSDAMAEHNPSGMLQYYILSKLVHFCHGASAPELRGAGLYCFYFYIILKTVNIILKTFKDEKIHAYICRLLYIMDFQCP